MNELSLFSGAGGGLLGTRLLGFRSVGYVENNDYCQRVIAARIKDGYLDDAPIFGDIETFIGGGYAAQYQGVADVVTAGFPCQPFSGSGQMRGKDDDRNKWPETFEVISRVRPQFALLENVPGLIYSGYISKVCGDLAEIFPDIKGAVVGNNDIGSGICRSERLWIIASASDGPMLESLDFSKHQITNPEKSFRRQHSGAILSTLSQDDYARVKRDTNAVARGMDRLKAVGNGQIPSVVKAVWEVLI